MEAPAEGPQALTRRAMTRARGPRAAGAAGPAPGPDSIRHPSGTRAPTSPASPGSHAVPGWRVGPRCPQRDANPPAGNRMVAADRTISSAATQHRPSTGTHVVPCSAVEQRLVVDLGVVAEREQVVLGSDDLRVAEPL